MPDNYYNPDDPTAPVRPNPPQQGQNPQGKLVLGSFQNPPKSPQRRPYQYPQSQQPPAGPPQNPQGYAHRQQVPPPMPTPVVNPRIHSYPSQQSASAMNARSLQKKRRPRGCLIATVVVLVIVCVLGTVAFTTGQRVLAFGNAISTQKPLTTQTNFMGTSARTNLLVIGYGGAGHDGALLTDSLLVVSLLPQSHHTSLISVPRDLWVQVPNSGGYGKINAVYEYASNFGKNPVAGGDAIAKKVSTVTGLDIKYWMTIDFNGFRELINSIGGVDVYVPDSFSALYPKNDDPAVNASYITISFKKGNQHMDGETAIRYARARKTLDNAAEGTDYARSARQQIIVKAVLAKVKQISTWPKFFDAMTALEKTIYTNMSLADLTEYALKIDMNDSHTAHIGLSTANVLVEDNAFNLHPKNGDYGVVADYVKQNLYN